MTRRYILIGLIASIAFQISVLAGEYIGAIYPQWVGQEIRLRTVPVDPRSLFRGNYALLKYDISRIPDVDLPERWKSNSVVYVKLKPDSDVYGYDGLFFERPESGLYIRGRLQSNQNVLYGIEALFAPRVKAIQLAKDLRNGGVAIVKLADNGKAALINVMPKNVDETETVSAFQGTLVSGVNSGGADLHPDISADGLSLYFASDRTGGQGEFDLWVATRKTKDGKWDRPRNLGSTVNSAQLEWCPRVSNDDLSLYFSSSRPGGAGGWDLWVTRRPTKNDSWGEPVNLGPVVNSRADDFSARLALDSLSLLFHSTRAGGLGGQDIWVTTRPTKSRPWGEPVNLGLTVNSQAADGDPYVSTDGLALYFFSDRIGGQGQADLWVTTRRTKKGAWGKPVNLGPKVNSEDMEWFGSISADGSILYFHSRRANVPGRTNIWQVSIAPTP